jgi:transposase
LPRTRRSFTPEYKREAVQLADDLGINATLIHRWRRQLRDGGRRAFPGNGSPRDEEVARLKRELKQVRGGGHHKKPSVGPGVAPGGQIKYRRVDTYDHAIPFAAGTIESHGVLDVQASYDVPTFGVTLLAGGTNLTNADNLSA